MANSPDYFAEGPVDATLSTKRVRFVVAAIILASNLLRRLTISEGKFCNLLLDKLSSTRRTTNPIPGHREVSWLCERSFWMEFCYSNCQANCFKASKFIVKLTKYSSITKSLKSADTSVNSLCDKFNCFNSRNRKISIGKSVSLLWRKFNLVNFSNWPISLGSCVSALSWSCVENGKVLDWKEIHRASQSDWDLRSKLSNRSAFQSPNWCSSKYWNSNPDCSRSFGSTRHHHRCHRCFAMWNGWPPLFPARGCSTPCPELKIRNLIPNPSIGQCNQQTISQAFSSQIQASRFPGMFYQSRRTYLIVLLFRLQMKYRIQILSTNSRFYVHFLLLFSKSKRFKRNQNNNRISAQKWLTADSSAAVLAAWRKSNQLEMSNSVSQLNFDTNCKQTWVHPAKCLSTQVICKIYNDFLSK